MINKNKISLIVMLCAICAVTACKEESGTNPAEPPTQPTAVPCPAGTVVDIRTCSITNSAYAEQTKTCNANGKDSSWGECSVVACMPGFKKSANQCQVEPCTPGRIQQTSCISKIQNAVLAVEIQTCRSDGNSYEPGECKLEACYPGFLAKENKCIPETCRPTDPQGDQPCMDEILNSSEASKTKTCNSTGDQYVFGPCVLKSCNNGYVAKNDKCLPQTCKAGAEGGVQDCSSRIPFSLVATAPQKCNSSGTAYETGECTVSSCQPGYRVSENQCVAQACTPGASGGVVSCRGTIPFAASATQTRTCNSTGSGYNNGPCAADQCVTGYLLRSGACYAQVCSPAMPGGLQDCTYLIPNSSVAAMALTCTHDGLGYDNGLCQLKECKPGYYAQNNSCVAQSCEPNAKLGAVDCKADIPHSKAAMKGKTCNPAGSDYIYGACLIASCAPGYKVKENSCIPQVCQPEASPSPSPTLVDCKSEVPYAKSAGKTKNCNAKGTGYEYGNCHALACVDGYKVLKGACTPVIKTCPTGYKLSGNDCIEDKPLDPPNPGGGTEPKYSCYVHPSCAGPCEMKNPPILVKTLSDAPSSAACAASASTAKAELCQAGAFDTAVIWKGQNLGIQRCQ